MVASFPLRVREVSGEWRQPSPAPGDSTRFVALLAGDDGVPDGFRLTRGDPADADPVERRIEVDQTNSSWVVGEAVVVKWITEPLVFGVYTGYSTWMSGCGPVPVMLMKY